MIARMPAWLIGLAVAMALPASAGIAVAQTGQLPLTSPGEAQVNQLNGNIQQQQQIRGIQQQNQVETNRLQGQIQNSTPQPAPNPTPIIVGPRR